MNALIIISKWLPLINQLPRSWLQCLLLRLICLAKLVNNIIGAQADADDERLNKNLKLIRVVNHLTDKLRSTRSGSVISQLVTPFAMWKFSTHSLSMFTSSNSLLSVITRTEWCRPLVISFWKKKIRAWNLLVQFVFPSPLGFRPDDSNSMWRH